MRPTLESIQCIKLQKTLWQDNLWFRTRLSNLSMHQNLMKGLLKQNSGPQPQHFWFSRSGVRPENLHFSQLPRGCWCCQSRVHMWRITDIEEIVKRQTHHPQVTHLHLKNCSISAFIVSFFPKLAYSSAHFSSLQYSKALPQVVTDTKPGGSVEIL